LLLQVIEIMENPEPRETLPDRLLRVTALHPSRTALSRWAEPSTGRDISYAELSATTSLWARAITAHGGQPGDRIALLMRHDVEQIRALLTVLKTARIVVVLNPTDAEVRLRATLEDAEPFLVIADDSCWQLAESIARGLCACIRWDQLRTSRSNGPEPRPDAEATAFIVYTSGSSGRPKGVMLNHRQVMANALRLSSAMELGANDRVALLLSLSGLHGVNILWCALLRGAALLPFPVSERGVTGLRDWMIKREVSAFSASSSLFRSFMTTVASDQKLANVRVVRIGGELATSDDVRLFRLHFPTTSVLLNTLSSSEAGTIAYLRLSSSDDVPEGPLAVGYPFPGIGLEIIDDDGKPVPNGETGEIVVKSQNLAQGFWRDDVMSARRLSSDPQGTSTLRSGDWGKINARGMLEFLGRRDSRVKIHGWSVEISEVEQALGRTPGVARAVVCACEGTYGTRLDAYVLPQRDMSLTPGKMQRAARGLLPWHMVPTRFHIVDKFPLTPHGKIDRAKLLESASSVKPPPTATYETESEELVALIWSDALDLQGVGRDENFFELGGDSLTASVIAARLYGEAGIELDMTMFARYPTIALQASLITRNGNQASRRSQIPRAPGPRVLPLSFSQERIWHFCQNESGNRSYTILKRYRITGAVDVPILRRCLNKLIERHEPLRTTFQLGGSGPVQIVADSAEVALTVVDATQAPDKEAAVDEQMDLLASHKLDIGNHPLVRFTLIKISERAYNLLRSCHHILCDGFAWKIYLDELTQLYEAAVQDLSHPFARSPDLQYGDYAAWQRRLYSAESSGGQKLISWWRATLDTSPEPINWLPKRLKTDQPVPLEGYFYAKPDAPVWERITKLAGDQHVTLFCAWLSAFAAFLCARTERRDIIVGTYVSNRMRPELHGMFGDFSNLVTLRLTNEAQQTFRSWLVITRDAVSAATAHAAIPYEELRRSFAQEGKSLPTIDMIVMMGAPKSLVRFAGIEMVADVAVRQRMPWGLTLRIHQDTKECELMFDASIYDPDAVRCIIERWFGFVDEISQAPDIPIQQILPIQEILA
jgi:non-ribosomal peptide synthetase component F/acyl carrier protein